MKLVMEYEVSDDFTYHFTATVPFEYVSIDAFLYDLMTATLEAFNSKKYNFNFIGREFNYSTFSYFENPEKERGLEFSPPRVYTLEDWFQEHLYPV